MGRISRAHTHTFEKIRGDQLVLPTWCVHHFGVGIGYVPDGIMKGSVMDRIGSGKDRLWVMGFRVALDRFCLR
jgi:hypothetical protein